MTTEPDPSERLVALRTARPPQQFPHAQATKIATAGASLSAVFGIVAYLGHSAEVDASHATRELQRLAASQMAAASLYRPPPTTVVVMPSTVAPGTTVPVAPDAVATSLPTQVVAVPVPVAAPAPAPAPRPAGTQGGQGGQGAAVPVPAPANTTKSSG